MPDPKVTPQTIAANIGRISALGVTQPRSKQRVTTADLAFIDAAIALQKAGMAQVGAGAVDPIGPVACDPVDVAAAVVAVAVLAYHVYNSCLVGGDSEFVQMASRLNLAPNVSLDRMIEARNQLAGALGVERVG
ncbi:MAG TPA: hypothetical protein VN628_06985 [Vicinamibacterales bacterium]|nr:hypothetical protein [Vicinamibacterales bacterium]